uniref:Uncharacterized protein n=1 Tax=Zea mays TaxID=4577 RepID=B7ZY43_MAIZE|nr:unknown [Zea mays]ACL52895.1 unknown [Zea mays]
MVNNGLSDRDKNLGTMSHGSIQSEVWFAHLCSSDFSRSASFRASCRHSHSLLVDTHIFRALCSDIDLHASLVFQTLETMVLHATTLSSC